MVDAIVLIRRQSPDWAGIARDHRRGLAIAPSRYVPDHPIPGFPREIVRLVEAWNRRFAIDLFTVRAIIARLSRDSAASVAGGLSFGLTELDAVARLAASCRCVAFFHDDDDFFAPDILARLRATDVLAFDTCVFPLYRVHADVFTFVRPEMDPACVLGRRQDFDFRFQSNNYGLNARLCSEANLWALKDHVLGSGFADVQGFSETVFSFPVSATVKTPASASQLQDLLAPDGVLAQRFAGFIDQFSTPELPPDHDWLARPLAVIARLLRAVIDGAGHEAIADLLPENRQ